MNRLYVSVLATLALPLVHCMLPMTQPATGAQDPSAAGGAPEATSTSTSTSATPAAPNEPPASKSSSTKAAPSTPAASVPTTVEVHSDCPKTTPIFYGEKPKFGSGTKSSIGSNTTTTAGRKSDGTLTVWIIDDKENGIASVQVTPSTRRVEIDRSCRQITAR